MLGNYECCILARNYYVFEAYRIIVHNNNNFYSLDADSGIVNWVQNVNSVLRPVIVDDLIFAISKKGYLIVIKATTGEIIRVTYLLNGLKERIRKKGTRS